MSLLDKLREIESFATSHQPATGELLSVVGALVAYIEHGAELFAAAERDVKAREAGEPATHVDQLISGVEPEPEEPEPSPAGVTSAAGAPNVPSAPASDAESQARIADLEQQLQTAQAQLERTQTSVTPAVPAAPTPDTAPPPAAPEV